MVRADTVKEWHSHALPPETQDALTHLARSTWLKDSQWYLAGGTALALQVGHRLSVDLDFFTRETNFAPAGVIEKMPKEQWRTDTIREGTIFGRLFGAQVSFIAYPFFVPKEQFLRYGDISILNKKDIAVMKIIAISQRGRKRDFIDLYWYAHNCEPILEVIKRLPLQYPSVAHDYHHILKAMLYFEDAEEDPMPRIHFDADWETIKQYFKREVPKIAEELLGIKK